MRGRFGAKSSGGILRGLLPTIFFFTLVIVLFSCAVKGMTASVADEQLKSAEQAIRRTAVHCYAVEGQYPPSLDYMTEHYGLQVDQKRYVVHYQPIAANLMPNINVFLLSELDTPQNTEIIDPFQIPDYGTVIIDDEGAI